MSENTRSILGYAILGLLAREPLSGYDLAQRLKAPIGFFWTARHSQIYPELARLEALGMVTHELVEQSDKPDKKVYTITQAGRAALAEWVCAPVSRQPARDELILKAYSLWVAEPAKALDLFREREQVHAARLEEYERRLAHMEARSGSNLERIDSPDFASYVTLRRGLGYEREFLSWCRWLIERLERATDGNALR
jgi:DNA-binding PadR family transcriptional regulator